ncbi:MAG: AI-2E family transporter [Desulfosarcinaceae bacterium]|nr:AI-2E family transporter [Desulfosarcinaceae bacterium]
MQRETVNKSVLLLVVLFISAIFLSMIRSFLMAIFLAGLFAAMVHPIYARLEHLFKGRRSLASLTTLLLVICFILLPLAGLMGIVTAQALKVGQAVTPWVQKQIAEPDAFFTFLKSLPYFDQIAPYRDLFIEKAGEMVGGISAFLIHSLSSGAKGTMTFLFSTFVLLYTMYFFLMDGYQLVNKILYYLPLEDADEQRLLQRFTSVARATLKGTAVIGVLQGGLAGLAFAVVGIPSPAFWGLIMILLSILPGIGTALVWVPAAVILAASGNAAKAVGLALFCGAVVGSMDNLLRPRLVGKDTQMHELLIFFGTLGGILMFGVVGFIIGPIIAALFITVWDIYGVSFASVLPGTGPRSAEDADATGAEARLPSAPSPAGPARETDDPPAAD